MAEYFRPYIERKEMITICNQWIEWHILINKPIKEIIRYAKSLSSFVLMLLPPLKENKAYSSHIVRVLIVDILNMENLTQEQKEKKIIELIKSFKQELQDLAYQVIKYINNELQEYLKSIEGRGFEEDTIQRIKGESEEEY